MSDPLARVRGRELDGCSLRGCNGTGVETDTPVTCDYRGRMYGRPHLRGFRMNVQSALGAAGHVPSLADQLAHVGALARSAATFADGEYIPQMSRANELARSLHEATTASSVLEDLLPRIATLDGGEDGLRLARTALEELTSGRMALRDGVVDGDDLVRGGTAVADAIATGSAGQMFREAESKVRGIADIALLESMSPDDVLRGLAGR